MDEVGRGPLAGPVVAAAVILPEDFFLAGIDDSKKLTEKKREEFNEIIRSQALAISISMIQAAEIDAINIYEATKKAMKAAIAGLVPRPDFILIDAMSWKYRSPPNQLLREMRKVFRLQRLGLLRKWLEDGLMKDLAKTYPQYGFEQNMGYGTKEHINAIYSFGITPYHRKSFAPIKDLIASV